MPRIAIVTCLNLPEPDVDQDLVLSAFTAAGLYPTLAAWDDPEVEWSGFDAAIIRSTWDYPERPEAFRAWVESVDGATKLFNPAATVLPNLDKRYLLELQRQGIPIVPSVVVNQDLAELDAIDADRIVIKPAIGAGSFLTAFFDRADAAGMVNHVAEIHAFGAVALAQPFMNSVTNGGERSLVWVDGQFTHKIVKQPRFSGGEESVSSTAVPFEALELEMAGRVIDTLPEQPLYARVDLIEDGGKFVLNELELIEPSLFFLQSPTALERFVQGVLKRV
jgi:glutathione synthase/RimK-type ligase-like ATP-grasp enzyme